MAWQAGEAGQAGRKAGGGKLAPAGADLRPPAGAALERCGAARRVAAQRWLVHVLSHGALLHQRRLLEGRQEEGAAEAGRR